jgi:signal transduction histidine kinase
MDPETLSGPAAEGHPIDARYPGPSDEHGIWLKTVGSSGIRQVTSNPIVLDLLAAWESAGRNSFRPLPDLLDVRRAIGPNVTPHLVVHRHLYDPDDLELIEAGLGITRFTGEAIVGKTTRDIDPEIRNLMFQTWDTRSVGQRPMFMIGRSPVAINTFVTAWDRIVLPVSIGEKDEGSIGVSVPHDFASEVMTEFMDTLVEGVAVWSGAEWSLPCQFTNLVFDRMIGANNNRAVIGQLFLDIFPRLSSGVLLDAIQHVRTMGEPAVLERISFDAPFDPNKIYRVVIFADRDYIVTNFQDVTASIRQVDFLHSEKGKTKGLLDVLDVMGNDILVYGVDGGNLRVLDANRSFVRRTGFKVKDISGLSIIELGELMQGEWPILSKVTASLRKKQPDRFKVSLRTVTGNIVIYEATYCQFPSPDGSSVRIFAILRDITEEERELQLRAQVNRIEVIGRIGQTIVSDMKSCLRPIMTHLCQAESSFPKSNVDGDRLRVALESARQAVQLIHELGLAIGPHHDTAGVTRGDYVAVIEAAVDRFSASLPPDVVLSKIGFLSHGCADGTIKLGVTDINCIVRNLIVNAVDALVDGQGTIDICVSEIDDGRTCLLSVSDNGHGMDEEVKAMIFDPFFSTRPLSSGTGLGLSVVYRLVQICGGSISVESRVGGGTTFLLKIPVSR